MAVKQSKTFSFSPVWLMRLTHSPTQPWLVDTSVQEGRHIRPERDWWEHHCGSVVVGARKQSLVYLVYFFKTVGKGEEEGMEEEDRKKRSRGGGEQRKRKGGRDRHHLSGFQHCQLSIELGWPGEKEYLSRKCICLHGSEIKPQEEHWFSIIFLVFSHFCLFLIPSLLPLLIPYLPSLPEKRRNVSPNCLIFYCLWLSLKWQCALARNKSKLNLHRKTKLCAS